MARTKQNQRPASRPVLMGATGGRTQPSKLTVGLLTASVLAAIWAGAMLTSVGRVAYVYLFVYAEFYLGVLTLVSLSITVMAGLVATDRMMLSVRQRVLLQSAHRTTGIIAVVSLVFHVMTKVSMGRASGIDVLIPFLAQNQTVYLGLGTIAGYFMISVLWTGLVRARFAGRGKPWMWRGLHSIAYLAWPIALLHGLNAGRAAAGWVIASYVACVLLVVVALVVRLSISLGKRKDFASSTSAGGMKPVGQLVPTATPSAKSRSKRRTENKVDVVVEPVRSRVVSDKRNAPAAARDSWLDDVGDRAPAALAARRDDAFRPSDDQYRPSPRRSTRDEYQPAETATAADDYRPARAADDYRPARAADDYRPARAADDDRPARAADDDRPARAADDDRPARAADDDRPARAADDDRPAPRRSRRYAEDDEDRYAERDAAPPPRSRRSVPDDRNAADDRYEADGRYPADDRYDAERVEVDRYDDRERPRGRYSADDESTRSRWRGEAPQPRSRRRGEEELAYEAPQPRSRRRAEEELAYEAPQPRSRRYAEEESAYEAPQPRSRRYAEEESAYEAPQPRSRRRAEEESAYEAPQPRSRRRAEEESAYEAPQPRSRRRAEEDSAPSASWDRPADNDGYGRRARNDAFDLVDQWNDSADTDFTDVPPDETPTLVDMAARRARRDSSEGSRSSGRGSRRRKSYDDSVDDLYLRQLRGEAQ